MNKRFKRAMALLVCLVFCLSLLVTPAFGAKPAGKGQSGGTLTGKVTIFGTNTIIAGAVITASGTAGTYEAISDKKGSYKISLPEGTYNVTCEADNYNATVAEAAIVKGVTTTLNFALTTGAPTVQKGTITGLVKDNHGKAIAGASIKTTTGGYTATSDANGYYTLEGVEEGSYEVSVTAKGYKAATKTVVVTGNEVTTLTFALAAEEETTTPVVTYTAEHVFSIEDIQGDSDKTANSFGTSCLDLSNPVVDPKDGLTYYGVDSSFGYSVADYEGAVEKPRDGIYDDGFVANIYDSTGKVIGVKGKNVRPNEWLVATPLTGEWNVDANGAKTKASTEHYLVMEHWLNVPGAPPLEYGVDYRARFKDDGKKLYMWGNLNSEPTDLRFYARMPLPDPWKVDGADYKVTSAKLIVTHKLAKSPNDQLRPEDLENENATGILPQYTVRPDGSWVSTVNSTHGDDGDLCPAGTVLKLADPIAVPNVDENGEPLRDYWGNPVLEPDVVSFTGDWYTTLDRDPFAGDNPRWRLKAATFGQDLSAVKIPWYTAGQYTTTTIDLLAPMNDEETGQLIPSVLTRSTGWFGYMDDSDGILDGYSIQGVPMTKDFDLSYYIKGTLDGQEIYNAKLIIEYEDPNAGSEPPTEGNDVAITGLNVPSKISKGKTAELAVSVKNNMAGEASGTLSLTGTDTRGNNYTYSAPFVTAADGSTTTVKFNWVAPNYTTTVSWVAQVMAEGDTGSGNNSATGSTKVVK